MVRENLGIFMNLMIDVAFKRVYCTTPEENEHIVVEIQQVYHPHFENRAVLDF